MKLLCSGPVHREPMTLPYCWVLRHDEGKHMPYVVHRRCHMSEKDGVPLYISHCHGHYFDDLNKAMLCWLEKVKQDIERNTGKAD